MPLRKDECIRYAEQCEAMAKIARLDEVRTVLVDMAARWRELAKTARDAPPAT
jgi:hypothetical protein